jgi:hypothetical protein
MTEELVILLFHTRKLQNMEMWIKTMKTSQASVRSLLMNTLVCNVIPGMGGGRDFLLHYRGELISAEEGDDKEKDIQPMLVASCIFSRIKGKRFGKPNIYTHIPNRGKLLYLDLSGADPGICSRKCAA